MIGEGIELTITAGAGDRPGAMGVLGPAGLAPTPFEVAAGRPLGVHGRRQEFAPRGSRGALEDVIRPYLRRPPCVVGFSGGRDSSVLLAVAVQLARREGYPEPIAASLRFPFAETQESSWQELVIGHLGVPDWVRVECEDELDMVGPLATAGLRRHGIMYPPNIHIVALLARQASGGSVLMGTGGDDVFGGWPWHRLQAVSAGHRRPRLRDLRTAAHACAPQALRREVVLRRSRLLLPWLRGEVRREVAESSARDLVAARTLRWDRRMEWLGRSRLWRAASCSSALLGADQDVRVGSPFIEPAYLAALGNEGGRRGWGDRTATMTALFGDLLPGALLERRTKAYFSRPFFGPATWDFAARWDGRSGIDTDAFDADRLRDVWLSGQPHIGSALALQSAWLASEAA